MAKNTKQLKNTLASWLVLTRENRAELVSKCLMVTFDYPFRGGLNAQIKSSQAPVANEFAFVSLEFLAGALRPALRFSAWKDGSFCTPEFRALRPLPKHAAV